jgi:hypothetical protein
VTASTSNDCKSTLPAIETGTSIKADGIRKLTGVDNYQTWETQIEYLLISINADEIVVENFQPPVDATAEELQLYLKIIKSAMAIVIQILTPEIHATCAHHLSPNELGTYLHSLDY